ncbi:YjcZ family sporulation protein [Sporosarcina jiandibaonis]|nr:YjcZ family sporulation protein [Sporosarcina jiandibaonis]
MSSEIEKKVGSFGCGSGFALIVVLFILLIIVGAAFVDHGFDGGHGYCY